MEEKWTVEELKNTAKKLGKDFQPADDIKNRLAQDLANGALVLLH